MFRILAKSTLATFLLLSAAWADGGGDAPAFQDVRLGVDGDVTRLVVECAGPCNASRDVDGRFFLTGVSGAMSADLSAQNGFITRLVIENLYTGAFLTIGTRSRPDSISVADCGGETICIDFTKRPVPQPIARKATPVAAEALPDVTRAAPQKQPARAAPTPLAPPEAAGSAQTQPDGLLTTTGQWAKKGALDFSMIEATDLSPEACDHYQALLQKDAWDLDAYRMLALCEAARGDIRKAETLYERVLKVYPDDKFSNQMFRMLATVEEEPIVRTARR